jgi:hypothetical protein
MVSESFLASLGIPPRTRLWPAVEAPQTRPVALIDSETPLRHVIHFMDEESPRFEDKPAGVTSAEIWVKLGDTPPTDIDELTMLALDTRSPYIAQYSRQHAGEQAHYRLRWVNASGERGPWSRSYSVLIGG